MAISDMAITNAGVRLWEIQKAQGTGLCIGLDPQYEPDGILNETFYARFFSMLLYEHFRHRMEFQTARFLDGVGGYLCKVVNAAWYAGIRVFKTQSAAYEKFHPFGGEVLRLVCGHIHNLADRDHCRAFLIFDGKRGDIQESQLPYYEAYLSDQNEEIIPGMNGQYGFDAMTVTTWMGEDVLRCGLPFFKKGKSAIVVTKSSNASGTTLQDALVAANPWIPILRAQEVFRLKEEIREVKEIIGRNPAMHEMMLFLTSRFSREEQLESEGVSPIFSVVGSTVMADHAFRALRPGGIALIPGFGAQGGQFYRVMPLAAKEGPLAGHLGILSSSRAHNYPWMEKYGGAGNPQNLHFEMTRAIQMFRETEKAAYEVAGINYPF